MRAALLFMIACSTASAAYTSKGTVTFLAATGSTATNITQYFTATDVKLKTVANGGQVQNTVTQHGLTVPADFVATSDATCATTTGYTWDIIFYDGTTSGIVYGRILVPSLTTSATVVPTICVGNAAVNTFQGGSAGSSADSNTVLDLPLSDGTTLSVLDWSATGITGTNVTATATTGKVDGGAAMSGTAQYASFTNNSALDLTTATVEAWINPATLVGIEQEIYTRGAFGSSGYYVFIDSTGHPGMVFGTGGNLTTCTCTVTVNTWQHIAWELSTASHAIFINGVSQTLSGAAASAITAGTNIAYLGVYSNTVQNFYKGSVDEVKVSSALRSANWLATEVANQSTLPVMSALTAIASVTTSQGLVF